MRSDRIKKGIERVPHRALLYATGIRKKSLSKPFILVATSFSDIIPGHIGMRDLERFIERGVCSAGGVPFFSGIPGICDGIAMGHLGMHYSLPSRELIADSLESVVQAHAFDGVVCLTNCDKITPGMLMAAARLNVPTIIVTAGPMLSGKMGSRKLAFVHDTFEALARAKKGEISKDELSCLEQEACPGAGSCQGLYTANTMSCVTESLGMSLTGCATSLSVLAKKKRIAEESGEKIVELVRKNIKPRDIMIKDAFENAIMVDMALGGSTNTVLHIKAIAHEAGIDLPLKTFDRLSKKVPNISCIEPAGLHMMEDLEYAGGIPAVLKRLKNKIHNVPTLNGKTTKQIADEARIIDDDVIRTEKKAYRKEGGIAVLYGNIAPDGAVVKQSAVSLKMMKFTGRARTYNSEEAAMKDILGRKIKKGDCVVIRYEGPKGGPGMREMLAPTSAIVGLGLEDDVALITDGRFSGGTKGPCIGHISPEAAAGGVIALIEDGDKIQIDITKRKLTLCVDAEELKKRKRKLKIIKPKITTGYLARYAKLVTSASTGAIVK
ncbi:MAG TPA: dihydroxy-acid dehydratase [Candidatus Omnitrophica bacterium]|nr:dihydroxy-acid dehydratase [Candidatus Omnitrophota bacterium]